MKNLKPYIKNKKYNSEFYTTFTYNFEFLPRIGFRYRKQKFNSVVIEWLWFGFYVQVFSDVK